MSLVDSKDACEFQLDINYVTRSWINPCLREFLSSRVSILFGSIKHTEEVLLVRVVPDEGSRWSVMSSVGSMMINVLLPFTNLHILVLWYLVGWFPCLFSFVRANLKFKCPMVILNLMVPFFYSTCNQPSLPKNPVATDCLSSLLPFSFSLLEGQVWCYTRCNSGPTRASFSFRL